MKYKDQLLGLMTLLVEKTKSERGYTGTGRLINRILHTAATIYTLNSRYVNPDEWDSPGKEITPSSRSSIDVLSPDRVQQESDNSMG